MAIVGEAYEVGRRELIRDARTSWAWQGPADDLVAYISREHGWHADRTVSYLSDRLAARQDVEPAGSRLVGVWTMLRGANAASSSTTSRTCTATRPYLRPSHVSGQPGQRSGPVTRRAGAERGPREPASGEGAPEGEALDWPAQRPTITPRGWGGSRTRRPHA